MSAVEAIDGAVREVLRGEGFDLILVERLGRIVRLFIDRLPAAESEEGATAVTVGDCATVSRLVSDTLDAQGLSDGIGEQVGGGFNLEVSSPGLDRPLVLPTHFVRFIGREVKLQTRQAMQLQDGISRKVSGTLCSADPAAAGGIALMVADHEHHILYGAIEKARLIPQW